MIFREPHKSACSTQDDLVAEIHTTVVHESAHHFGIDDAALDELSYQ